MSYKKRRMWHTRPFWGVVLLAVLMTVSGVQAVGVAYLPFAVMYAVVLTLIGIVEVW